jgi:hypothetical protein
LLEIETQRMEVGELTAPSMERGMRIDVPNVAIHKKPKKALTIFEFTKTARTRYKNSNEVDDMLSIRKAPMTYRRAWQ